jgi:5-formyltetrahydrofolate cyclo-ligase
MITAEKQSLRERIRKLGAEHGHADSAWIRNALSSLEIWKRPSTVLLYAPLADEPDPMAIAADPGGHSVLFPRIEGDQLRLYRQLPGSRWIQAPRGFPGLREPDPASWTEAFPGEVDLALIPGLAFDPSGGRLGRGKGYYDRLLGSEDFRGLKIGIGWSWQLLPVVPREAHDVTMDLVIAGGEIHCPGKPSGEPFQRRILDKSGERE